MNSPTPPPASVTCSPRPSSAPTASPRSLGPGCSSCMSGSVAAAAAALSCGGGLCLEGRTSAGGGGGTGGARICGGCGLVLGSCRTSGNAIADDTPDASDIAISCGGPSGCRMTTSTGSLRFGFLQYFSAETSESSESRCCTCVGLGLGSTCSSPSPDDGFLVLLQRRRTARPSTLVLMNLPPSTLVAIFRVPSSPG